MGALLEALDQGVLVADLAALVACVLLGPASCQQRAHTSCRRVEALRHRQGVSYSSTCSGEASSLHVTCDIGLASWGQRPLYTHRVTYDVGRHG